MQFLFQPLPPLPSRKESRCPIAIRGLRSVWRSFRSAPSHCQCLQWQWPLSTGWLLTHQGSPLSGWKSHERSPLSLILIRGLLSSKLMRAQPTWYLAWNFLLGPCDQCSGRVRVCSPVKPAHTSSYHTFPGPRGISADSVTQETQGGSEEAMRPSSWSGTPVGPLFPEFWRRHGAKILQLFAGSLAKLSTLLYQSWVSENHDTSYFCLASPPQLFFYY